MESIIDVLIDWLGQGSIIVKVGAFAALAVIAYTSFLTIQNLRRKAKLQRTIQKDFEDKEAVNEIIEKLQTGLKTLRSSHIEKSVRLEGYEYSRSLDAIQEALEYLIRRFSNVGEYWSDRSTTWANISAYLSVGLAVIILPLSYEVSEQQSRMTSLESSLRTAQSDLTSSERRLSGAQASNQRLRQENADATSQIEDLQERIQSLTAEDDQAPSPPETDDAQEESNDLRDPDIQQRLEDVAASDGVVRFTLSWDDPSDLDLIVSCPNGDRIFYAIRSACGGRLDVDANVTSPSPNPVENIVFEEIVPGVYSITVDVHSHRSNSDIPFTLEIKVGENVSRIEKVLNARERYTTEVTVQ